MLRFTHPKLPSEAFVFLRGNAPTQSIGLVKLGVTGYFPVESPRVQVLKTESEARTLVQELNSARDITPLQAHCMEVGSMFGWDVPGADPGTYSDEEVAILTRKPN